MDIYQVLKKDHQKVKELMDALCNTTERALQKRERLFHELKLELEAHTRLEEELFYSILKSKEKSRLHTLTALEEHLLASNFLNELDKIPHDTELWTAKFGVLKENVERHIEEEESQLFKMGRAMINETKAEELGNTMQYKKEELLAAMS